MKQTKPQRLINYLLSESNSWSSASILASYLDVSTRQIRNYVSKINEEVKTNLIISSNQGYRLDTELYRKYGFKEKNTPISRVNYITQKLVSEKNGYDIFDLADELYVSLATIESDLKEVRQSFKKFDLTLHRDKNLLFIEGSEKKMRNLMSYLISSDSYDHFVLKDEVHLLTYHYHFWEFRTSIRDIFISNDIFINDYTLNNTTLHLIIMIDRIRSDYIIKTNDEIKKVEDTKNYHVACKIKEFIENKYQVQINDSELYNLTLVISNNTTMIDYNFINSNNISHYIEQKYIDITQKILHNVEEVYFLDAFNEDFITKFTLHIKNLFVRAENNYFAKNPLTSKIKMSFPLIYDISVFIAQELYRDYQLPLTEDEIAFIAFHIGSYFENNSQSQSKVNCAFIYADYYSIHKKILNKILMRFDNQINIKYAMSIGNYNENTIDCDLIISMIDMPFSKPSVIIQPFLTDKDIHHLSDFIEKISYKKRNSGLIDYLFNFFDERLFYKNPAFLTREEAIKTMANDVIQIHYADESLADDILAREMMSSTAFNNVSIPHSLRKSTRTSFISIALCDHALNWGDTQVNVIAMVGVNNDSRKMFTELFDTLIDILSEPSNVKELLKADNFNEFINLFKSLMNND